MEMKTTWVKFTPTPDGFRARAVGSEPGTPGRCCRRVDGECVDTAESNRS